MKKKSYGSLFKGQTTLSDIRAPLLNKYFLTLWYFSQSFDDHCKSFIINKKRKEI